MYLEVPATVQRQDSVSKHWNTMKKTAKTNTVTDEQGRVRFHGAFTGGFSAGYYNTVGSSEGFQPAQFVSSRSNRATQPNSRSIADYMDEGDGLLGGKLSAHDGIDSFSTSTTGQQGQLLQSNDASVSGSLVNERLINNITMLQKSSDTVGKRLLATMGWRVGQGIGPRVTKKRVNYFDTKLNTLEIHPGADVTKLPKSKLLSKGIVTFAPDDEAQRIEYPPIKNDFYGIGFDVRNSGRLDSVTAHGGTRASDYIDGSDDEDDANVYRMGDVLKGRAAGAKEVSKRPLSQPYGQPAQKAKRLKYTSGFAYNDEEDDVYSNDAPLLLGDGTSSGAQAQGKIVPHKYSHEVQEVSVYGDAASSEYLAQTAHKTAAFAEKSKETLQSINNSVDNWLAGGRGASAEGGLAGELDAAAPGTLSAALAAQRCPSDNRLPLPGFHVARSARVVPPHYPPLEVPADFRGRHSFADPSGAAASTGSSAAQQNTVLQSKLPSAGVIRRNQAPLDAAKARSAAMSEESSSSGPCADATESAKSSIFDLIKPEARAKLQSAINAVNPQTSVKLTIPSTEKASLPPPPPLPPLPSVPPPPPPPVATDENAAVPTRPMLTSSYLLNSTFAGLSQAFKNRFATASTVEGAGAKDSIVVEGMASAAEYNKKLAERQMEAQRKETALAAEAAKILAKVPVQKGTVRTITPWAPSPLLCKRFNVKLPEILSRPADFSAMDARSSSSALDPITQLLGGTSSDALPVPGFGKKGSGPDEIAAQLDRERREQEAALQDVYQAPVENKPALSVFKSIFEDSDSEDEEEEEKEEKGDLESEKVAPLKIKIGEDKATSIAAQAVDVTASKPISAGASAVAAEPVPLDGPVQFVPSRQRTTLSHAADGAGGGGVRGAARKSAVHVRRSFIRDDGGSDDDTAESGFAKPPRSGRKGASSLPGQAEESSGGEEGDGMLGMRLKPTTAAGRSNAQSVARIGGVGVGGVARRNGRSAVMQGSLRERLIAQRLAEEEAEKVEEAEGAEEGGGEEEVKVLGGGNKQNLQTSGRPARQSQDNYSSIGSSQHSRGTANGDGADRSVKSVAQPAREPKLSANDAAVEDVLSFVDNMFQPTITLPVQASPPAQVPAPPSAVFMARISRLAAAAVPSTGLSSEPPPMVAHAPAADMYGPPRPGVSNEGTTVTASSVSSLTPAQTSTRGASHAAGERAAPMKDADLQSSIQKLQGFLAPPEAEHAHKDKKPHKSHKSSKHKHKKSSSKGKHKSHKKKKDKEGNKNLRSRRETSSSSEDGDGSSSSAESGS